MCPKSFGWVRFDLGSLLQGRMWYFIPMMCYISPIIGRRGFGCEVNLYKIMCPESFGGVRFDIILCMSRFNHVPSRDTLRRDAISSFNNLFFNTSRANIARLFIGYARIIPFPSFSARGAVIRSIKREAKMSAFR